MKKITCHQYATGRGPNGYGFVAYSKTDPQKQEPSYTFSPNSAVGLRFAQLPAGTDYVFEVEPVSTDYLHSGAFITRNREEGGSSSVYTHILMTKDQTEDAEALGLLKLENFLTPDEFSQVSHSTKKLEVIERDCDFPENDNAKLNDDQLDRLGDFLAHYWFMMEQKEWSKKGTPELALQLSGMNQEEMISYFAKEIVLRFPKYVRPAISVSFGTRWSNRGSTPAVCCVLPDNSESPFPCYNPGLGQQNTARQSVPVEKEIGRMLVQGNSYPETYRRIEKYAEDDDSCRNMARGFSVMAYCVQAAMSNAKIDQLLDSYNKLNKLAEKRYGIQQEELPTILFPIIQDVFDAYSRINKYDLENVLWMFHQNAGLHLADKKRIAPEELKKNDESLQQGFRTLKLEQMKYVIYTLWEELRSKNYESSTIYSLLQKAEENLFDKHCEARAIQSALEQCERLEKEKIEETKKLTDRYLEWLCKTDNSAAMLQVLCEENVQNRLSNELFFSLLERIKSQPEKMEAAAIANYFRALQNAKKKDHNRADELIEEVYQSLLNGIIRLKNVAADEFVVIAEIILSQPQTKETVNKTFDFVIQNQSVGSAPLFMKQIAEMAIDAKDISEQEYQQVLFEKLEDSMQNDRFDMENAVTKLLEKTNNCIISKKTLQKCEEIRRARLSKCIEHFFKETNIEPGKDPGKDWNRLYAKKYAIKWDELEATDMASPVENRFEETYEMSDDRIGLLKGAWEQAQQDNQKAYSSALKKAIIVKAGRVYDPLWQEGDDRERNELDQLIQSCSETEYGEGLIEKCKNTTAGKAREFMNELGKLSKSGMDLAPVKAGKLIREMREEKGFNQCFDIDNKMDHKTGDKLYQLVISLLREIQKEPEGNNYWKEPLAELEFDSSKPVWNDDGFRMLNILAYITKSMEEMEIPEMNDDLKNYLGTEYMKQLWKESKANERIYQGQGSTVFVGSLFQWMDK